MTISLRRARVRYGPLEALHGVTLAAPTRGLTVLLGRNGSGRTTVLRALAGTVALSGGAVVWDGAEVTRVPAYERARRGCVWCRSGGPCSGRSPCARTSNSPRGTAPWLSTRIPGWSRCSPAGRPRSPGRAADAGAVAGAAGTRAWVLVDEPAQGMSPAVAAHTYELLAGLDACVVVAEQRLPPVLRGRGALVYELRRGAVVFGGEAAERE